MTTAEDARTIIVTFHRKDRRKNQSSDKVELAQKMAGAGGHILDVDLYEAPILVFNAAQEEIERLRNDPNVSTVEEDGAFHVQENVAGGDVTPHAEPTPDGVSQIGAPQAWDAFGNSGSGQWTWLGTTPAHQYLTAGRIEHHAHAACCRSSANWPHSSSSTTCPRI